MDRLMNARTCEFTDCLESNDGLEINGVAVCVKHIDFAMSKALKPVHDAIAGIAMEDAPRCEYLGGGSVQCCEPAGHEGGHMYKCAGTYCPGLSWIASNTPHPTQCNVPPVSE